MNEAALLAPQSHVAPAMTQCLSQGAESKQILRWQLSISFMSYATMPPANSSAWPRLLVSGYCTGSLIMAALAVPSLHQKVAFLSQLVA